MCSRSFVLVVMYVSLTHHLLVFSEAKLDGGVEEKKKTLSLAALSPL